MDFISEQLLTTNIAINSNEITKNIDSTIRMKLKNQLEGLCFEDGYIIKDTVKIIHKSIGKVVISDNKSYIKFPIKYKAKVICPAEGDIIDSYISNINKMGIVTYIKLNEGDTSNESPLVIMVPNEYLKESIYNMEDLHIGQKLTVKVIGSRIKFKSDKIQVIAKIERE